MKQNVLQASLEGIEIFPLVALVLFFGVFVYAVVRSIIVNKSFVRKMSEMPLELDTEGFKEDNAKNPIT